ncbi:MAG: hypothetical protein V1674_07605 [Candidatus Omnitrophota bacterium]
MRIRDLINTSSVVLLIMHALKVCRQIDLKIEASFESGHLYSLINFLKNPPKDSYVFSVIKKSARFNCKSTVYFNNSRIIRYCKKSSSMLKTEVAILFGTSKIINSIKLLEENFSSIPIRTGSIIIITAIITDMLMSVGFHKEISLLRWMLLGSSLLFCFIGFFCKATWQDIVRNSLSLKWIKR